MNFSLLVYFKPLKKLFDMTDMVILWKRLYATYPELDNVAESRDWTRAEIARMLEHANDEMERALILVLISSCVHIGGLVDLDRGGGSDCHVLERRGADAESWCRGSRCRLCRDEGVQRLGRRLPGVYDAGGI